MIKLFYLHIALHLEARAALAKSGWFVAKAPGALGKREMTVASLEKRRSVTLKG